MDTQVKNDQVQEVMDDDYEIVYDESDEQKPITQNQNEETDAEDEKDEAKSTVEESEVKASEADTEPEAEPEPETETEEDEEEEDEEYKNYSANVKKRIKREIKLRKQVEQNLAIAVQQRNQALMQLSALSQTAEQAKNIQEQYDNLQEQYYKLLDVSLMSAIDQKLKDLHKAKEEGNTEDELRLQGEIDELRFNKRQLVEIVNNFNAQKQLKQQTGRLNLSPQVGAQPMGMPAMGAPAVPQLALDWVKKNAWIKESKYAPQREYIKTLDTILLQEGYDPNTEVYYTELEKRLYNAFPSLKKKKGQKPTKNSPVAPSTNNVGGTVKNVGSKRIVLTRADMETMRKFGLDPANREHVIHFAKQRMEAANG